MKVLRALTNKQFDQLKDWNSKRDFNWTEASELVVLGMVCDTGSKYHSCGCERSFTGINTLKGTTIAIVDEAQVREEFAASNFVKEWGRFIDTDTMYGDIEQLAGSLSRFRVGDFVRIESTTTQYVIYSHDLKSKPKL